MQSGDKCGEGSSVYFPTMWSSESSRPLRVLYKSTSIHSHSDSIGTLLNLGFRVEGLNRQPSDHWNSSFATHLRAQPVLSAAHTKRGSRVSSQRCCEMDLRTKSSRQLDFLHFRFVFLIWIVRCLREGKSRLLKLYLLSTIERDSSF